MGHQRLARPVPGRDEVAHQTGDGIRHRVGTSTPGVAEADPGVVRGEGQVDPGLQVQPVEDRPAQVAADVLDRLLAPDVAGRVGPM